MRKIIVGVYDKGSGTVVHSLHELFNVDEGVCYASIDAQSFYVGQGGWGGPRGPKVVEICTPGDQEGGRKPDIVHYEQTNTETSLLYRLNGDYNPLHATPEPGKAMGFSGVINHGLIAWNMCAHAVVRSVGLGNGSSLLSFQARFAAPVLPGDQLCVEMWLHDDIEMESGVVEVEFLCRVNGKIVLKAGRALIKRVLDVEAKI